MGEISEAQLALENMLEEIVWQTRRTWNCKPIKNIDLVLFCGKTKRETV